MSPVKHVEDLQAYGLQVGDVLVLPGGVETTITAITVYDLLSGRFLARCYSSGENPPADALANVSGRWSVMYLAGEYNVIRFPHETVTRRR